MENTMTKPNNSPLRAVRQYTEENGVFVHKTGQRMRKINPIFQQRLLHRNKINSYNNVLRKQL